MIFPRGIVWTADKRGWTQMGQKPPTAIKSQVSNPATTALPWGFNAVQT